MTLPFSISKHSSVFYFLIKRANIKFSINQIWNFTKYCYFHHWLSFFPFLCIGLWRSKTSHHFLKGRKKTGLQQWYCDLQIATSYNSSVWIWCNANDQHYKCHLSNIMIERCKHLTKLRVNHNHSILDPQQWHCHSCGTTESVWVSNDTHRVVTS